MMAIIKLGCCGFPTAQRRYYEMFDLVEIQQTFYHPPELRTAVRWRNEAPPQFEFTIKAWQLITHPPSSPTYRRLRQPIPEEKRSHYGLFQPTDEVMAAWQQTGEVAGALNASVIVFQCPPRFDPSPQHKENMRAFFRSIERTSRWFVWEPRGRWTLEEMLPLCNELDLVPCVDPFTEHTIPHRGIAYLRLHGKTGYASSYTDEDLNEIVSRLPEAKEVYILFNNVPMLEDAKRFKALLHLRPS